jgi:hypothetical protein
MNVPPTTSNVVVPPPVAPPVVDPNPLPPAEPNKLLADAEPPPKLVAPPVLDPVPTPGANVPVDPLLMETPPVPAPKPPVRPVEKGTKLVTVVGRDKLVLFFLLPPLAVGVPGIVVVTALNPTGLKPAPKLPAPFAFVVPPNERDPIPVAALTDPVCEPVAPAAALP